ncbi:hypothetical protein T01_4769 [Trichinella spiralis]|uniref:Uncharacterized protein n=1 Tax=Trichinella spiralis TaxID=6334 RepID=A0A0V1BVZ7_TRISP|nr:hypothetical protein T01_4769 [Trichinella spiralis]
MSSHEARTDANQCSRGVSIPFSSRPSVPLLITNTMDYVIRKFLFILSRWHSQVGFPTVLMFFLVTQVRDCEDAAS